MKVLAGPASTSEMKEKAEEAKVTMSKEENFLTNFQNNEASKEMLLKQYSILDQQQRHIQDLMDEKNVKQNLDSHVCERKRWPATLPSVQDFFTKIPHRLQNCLQGLKPLVKNEENFDSTNSLMLGEEAFKTWEINLERQMQTWRLEPFSEKLAPGRQQFWRLGKAGAQASELQVGVNFSVRRWRRGARTASVAIHIRALVKPPGGAAPLDPST